MSEFAFERGRRMVSSSPEDLAPSPEPRFLASSPVSEDDVATRVFGVALQQEGGGHRRSASSCVVGQRKQKIIGVEERNPKKKRRRTVSNRPIEKKEKTQPQNKKIPGEPIPLEHEWTFWFDGRAGVGMREHDYKHSIVPIGSFDSIQDFWRYWNNIEPWKFSIFSNLRLFKKGVTPMWEDKANINGGRWVMQCEKEHSHIFLGKLVLAVIGEQLLHSEKLCGMVYQVRKTHNILSLWSGVGGPDHYIERVMKQLRCILQLPDNTPIGFVLHQGSIQWNANQKLVPVKGGRGGKRGGQPSRLIASAPDNGFTKEKVPYYFQTPVASSLKSTSLSLSSVVPQPDSPSPSLQFVEEPLPQVLPNGPKLSEGLTKTIERIRSGEDLPLQEAQALSSPLSPLSSPLSPLSSSESRATSMIQEAASKKIEDKSFKTIPKVKKVKGLLCVTAAVTTAFVAAVATVTTFIQPDFLNL